MKNNMKLIITIIGVIMLVGLGITFAYYSINITGNPTSENIEIGAGTVSLVFSDGSSTINVQNVLPGWSAQKTFTVTNTSSVTDAELSYNVILVVTSNGFNASSMHYSLTGSGVGAISKADTEIAAGASNITIGTAKITGTGTVHTYTLTISYPNKTADQSSEMGKTFTGYVTIEGAGQIAEEPKYLAQTVIKKGETDGLYNYGTAGYRYSGATPNNYITFNDETWRIIGFVDGSQIGKTAGTYYTKIIRNESIGSKQWHSGNVNTWYTSSLYNTLNNTSAYINNTNVETVNWYHKARNDANLMTSAMYSAEGWGSSCSSSSKNCTKSAKVGIISPSDYGYASSTCYNSKNLSAYKDDSCTGSNWLFINGTQQWLLEPNATYANGAWRVDATGYLYGDSDVLIGRAVRPVVYLVPSAVAGGEGTLSDPYAISD